MGDTVCTGEGEGGDWRLPRWHAGGGKDNGKAAGVGGAMMDCGDAHVGGGALTFLQPLLVLVETFKPKSLLSRHYPSLPFRPNLKAHFCVYS